MTSKTLHLRLIGSSNDAVRRAHAAFQPATDVPASLDTVGGLIIKLGLPLFCAKYGLTVEGVTNATTETKKNK